MKQIVLKSRPRGTVRGDDLAIVEVPLPEIGDGQILIRADWLSVDPYIRLMLDGNAFGAAAAIPLGSPMPGSIVGEVVASKSDAFAVGDIVEGRASWAEFVVLNTAAPGLRRIAGLPAQSPASALGALGMPGQTAYAGMVNIGRVAAGETVVISAAAGAVGSVAGQIGKIKGARVVGIAGSPEKCAAVRALGFDDCVDYKSADFAERLAAAVPEGIDLYFENVGGAVTRAVLPLMKPGGRVPICGFISLYGEGEEVSGPDQLPWLMRMMMLKGLEMRGFGGAMTGGQDALDQLAEWAAVGRIRAVETVVEGLENAPAAFAGLFGANRNIGKLVIRIGHAGGVEK